MSDARVIAALYSEQIALQRTNHSINMKVRQQESKAAVSTALSIRYSGESSRHSTAVESYPEEEPVWTPESQFPAPVAVLQLVTGRWVANIVGVAAELGLADLIQTGPKTAEEIAAAKGLHAPSLHRFLRALASVGVFAEQPEGRFAQTPMSDALRSDVPHSMRGVARFAIRPWSIQAWMELEHTLQTGASAFEHAHGMKIFDYLTQHPSEMKIFADAMSSFTSHIGVAVAQAYDFSSIGVLADIGGSHGMILAIVLAKHPALRGILFDLPAVVEGASTVLRTRGVEHRVEIRAGNFFETVPQGADAYLLKHILHDWGDGDSVRILKCVHAAAKPGAKLLVVESIVESLNEPQFAKIADIEMLVQTHGGRERTRSEWQNLLSAGGFRFLRAVPTSSSVHVIEALRD
jgi:hypothetical protein